MFHNLFLYLCQFDSTNKSGVEILVVAQDLCAWIKSLILLDLNSVVVPFVVVVVVFFLPH